MSGPGEVWVEQSGSGQRNWSALASSADGTKLVASVTSGYIYTSTDSGVTWTERTGSGSTNWSSVASSADGVKLAAVSLLHIYTSTDSGVTWTNQFGSEASNWYGVASSSDGTKLVACNNNGYIYTSTDSGVNWTERTGSGSNNWYGVASSSDGTKLVATSQFGYIHTSTDSGATWTQQTASEQRKWYGIESSADGTKLVAGVDAGYIYTSTDSGVTWTERTSAGPRAWGALASSSDGTKLIACDNGGYLYTSTDSGVTWTEQIGSVQRDWYGVASSSDGNKLVAAVGTTGYIYTSAYIGGPIIILPSIPCFKEGALILTEKGEVPVQDLRKGDKVKTLKHEFLAVEMVGKRDMFHKADAENRIVDQLYVGPNDLVLTGAHALLEDNFEDEQQREDVLDIYGKIYVTDNKYRVPACVHKDFTVFEEKGMHTIYHFALENENYYSNYGVFANGVLVETCSKRYLKEISNMKIND